MRNFRGVTLELQDMSNASLCRRGGRRFFATHELDWAAFVRDGINVKEILATGDGLSQSTVENCLRRHGFEQHLIDGIIKKYYG